jgi:hypothetical protein
MWKHQGDACIEKNDFFLMTNGHYNKFSKPNLNTLIVATLPKVVSRVNGQNQSAFKITYIFFVFINP